MANTGQRERTTFATPEGVSFELTVSGLGSRFFAVIVDMVLQFGVVGAVSVANPGSFQKGGIAAALASIAVFVSMFGYPFLCESFLRGRTLGKRLAGLRVVDAGGGPASVAQCGVRNLLRIIDFLPLSYVVGVGFILASSKAQRIGDVFADTIVIVERPNRKRADQHRFALTDLHPTSPRWETASASSRSDQVFLWDVVAVTAKDVGIVEQFLARRSDLEIGVRERIATEFAAKLRRVVVGADDCVDPEAFLESVVEAKRMRRNSSG